MVVRAAFSLDGVRALGIPSPMERFKNSFRMGLGDTQEGTGSAFGLAVTLFPILQGPGADPDEGGKAGLAETQLFADCPGIG